MSKIFQFWHFSYLLLLKAFESCENSEIISEKKKLKKFNIKSWFLDLDDQGKK